MRWLSDAVEVLRVVALFFAIVALMAVGIGMAVRLATWAAGS